MSETLPDLAFVQRALEAAPFHRWLGLTATETGAGEIKLSMPWRDEVVSNPKVQAAHGGVLAALVDSGAVFAVVARTGLLAATVDLRTDYHAVPISATMRLAGWGLRCQWRRLVFSTVLVICCRVAEALIEC